MPFRWLFDEGQRQEACLDRLAYEEWLAFVFDHPAAGKSEDRWYCQDDAASYYFKDSRLFLSRLGRLLIEPEILLAPYSLEQIKQGFWCFISAFELPDVLEDAGIPFEARAHCIAAFEPLYRRLFSRKGLEKIAFTYWEPLTYSFSTRAGRPENDDHARVQEAMFKALSAILGHKERICFLSALHGLGHLRHPAASQAIRGALERREGLRAPDRDYALACEKGEMDALPLPSLE
jgi:hypothetical protein